MSRNNNYKQKRNTALEKKTRIIFHNLHVAQGEDSKIFSRLQSLLNSEYLRVKKDFFIGKVCLDAGCGSNANATLAMLKMGAKKVFAFDLDRSILEKAPKYLSKFKGRYDLSCGNVLDMDYPDKLFDFTYCTGVLHHTADAPRGIKELARVTKIGGIVCIGINGSGGVIREITNLLRDKYSKDSEFKDFVDGLSNKFLSDVWKWIVKSMSAHGDKIGRKIPLLVIKELFDNDMILTIKDRITAPVYYEFTEGQMRSLLSASGLGKIERLTRYPKMRNVRRFLCPFYSDYDNKLSKLFYGEGYIQLKAERVR